MSSSMQIAEAWAVASCVDKLIKKIEENKDLLSEEDIDKLEFKQQHENFLHHQTILEVVDSIVSVVSGTLTEEVPYGARLYHDGDEFHHSVDCECACCLFGNAEIITEEPITPREEDSESVLSTPPVRNSEEPTNVRRRLFDDEETLIDESVLEDRQCEKCGIYESDAIEINPECPDFIDMGPAMRGDGSRRTMCIQCFSEIERIGTRRICGACGGDYEVDHPCDCAFLWYMDRDGDQTYIDEYENEELPENNTEKVRVVKDSVKEMGEFVYDLQEKLSEGEYLKLMDQLQKITNSVNNL